MCDCIEHTQKGYNGYGCKMVKINGVWRTAKLHRLAYCEANHLTLDDIAGLVVMHTCDNPRCINPAHLVLGTQGDNNRDRDAKGRGARGRVLATRSKLSDDDVRRMRGLHKLLPDVFTGNALGTVFGVDGSTARAVIRGETYTDVGIHEMDTDMLRVWASRLTGYRAYKVNRLLKKII